MTADDARRKVRALLSLAKDGSGATDAERANARAAAERLTKEYDLDKPARRAPTITVQVSGDAFVFTSHPDDLRERIRQALRSGDAEKVVALKRELFRDILRGRT